MGSNTIIPSNSLQTPQEVALFVMALGYNRNQHVGRALQALDANNLYAALGLHNVIAGGYKQAGEHIALLGLDHLTRDALDTLLKEEIFPTGRAAEDFQYNVLEVFDKLTAALAAGQFKGFREASAQAMPSAHAIEGQETLISKPITIQI